MSELEVEGTPPMPPDMAVIRNPSMFSSLFRGEYSPLVTNLHKVVGGDQDNIYSVVRPETIGETLAGVNKLFGDGGYPPEGGPAIQRAVYKPFAFEHGFIRETEWGPAVLPFDELDIGQQAEWETYLHSVAFIENRRRLVASGIKDIIFPTVPTKYEKAVNIPLAAELERVKRSIVRRLIPNITDEEAKEALGLEYTADIARSEVTPEWFIR
jgi:hypothetical protein